MASPVLLLCRFWRCGLVVMSSGLGRCSRCVVVCRWGMYNVHRSRMYGMDVAVLVFGVCAS